MFDASQYQLLDFGEGRKLERFGQLVLDRVAPATESDLPADPESWKQSHFSYRRRAAGKGSWVGNKQLTSELESLRDDGFPAPWKIQYKQLQMELSLTPSSQVGLFPEQVTNWDWIGEQIRRANQPLKILNLFAYTGGSTFAAVSAGAEVVHVDAARNIIAWARRNAQHSGFQDAPIRWVCEDCLTFVRREVRRGNEYDAVIMDPPSYGHGPDGQQWKIQQHLGPLLDACAELTRGHRQFILLSCHSPAYGPADLHALLADHILGSCQQGGDARSLNVECVNGRKLPSGVVARWPG